MTQKDTAGQTQQFVDIKTVKDGIVVLKNGGLRKIILVDGINFDLKSDEEQQIITYGYQNFLNSLDFAVQLNIHSRKLNIDDYLKKLEERQTGETNELMKTQIGEYMQFIRSFTGENAVMTKSFFVTVPYSPSVIHNIGIKRSQAGQTTEPAEAGIDPIYRDQLNQRTEQVISGLRRVGLRAIALQDSELLELFYNFYNPTAVDRSLAESRGEERTETGDASAFLAPNSLEINPNYIKINEKFARTFFLLNYPRYLSGGWFSPIINLTRLSDISIHISPTDTGVALRSLKKKAAQLESQLMESQEKGQVRDPMLETAFSDVDSLRESLQQASERLFNVSVYITVYADTAEELNKIEGEVKNILDGKLVVTKPASFEHLNGFASTLPLGMDKLGIHSPLNSNPVSSFFPFVSLDLTSDKGILYGINRHNNTLVIFDRFSLENANMVIFAMSGSGKSYATKLEIIRSLMIGTDIIVVDPENEYLKMAEAVGGSVLKISLDSDTHINPFDIPVIPGDEDPGEVLKSHIINLTALIQLMFGKISP